MWSEFNNFCRGQKGQLFKMTKNDFKIQGHAMFIGVMNFGQVDII